MNLLVVSLLTMFSLSLVSDITTVALTKLSLCDSDSFDAYEKNFPDLVAIDSSGRFLTKTDFLAREKEEMSQLTKASMLSDNIWVRCLFLGPTVSVNRCSIISIYVDL